MDYQQFYVFPFVITQPIIYYDYFSNSTELDQKTNDESKPKQENLSYKFKQ
jgi:hypothetical protein